MTKSSSGPSGVAFPHFCDLGRRSQGFVALLSRQLLLIPTIPADFVQDLYLREIKAYKPAPTVR